MKITLENKIQSNVWLDRGLQANIDLDLTYRISIKDANPCCFLNLLQIIFEVKNEEHNISEYLLVDYVVGSTSWLELMDNIYSGTGRIVEVNTDDFKAFTADCKLKVCNGKIVPDLETIEIDTTPYSAMNIYLYGE